MLFQISGRTLSQHVRMLDLTTISQHVRMSDLTTPCSIYNENYSGDFSESFIVNAEVYELEGGGRK